MAEQAAISTPITPRRALSLIAIVILIAVAVLILGAIALAVAVLTPRLVAQLTPVQTAFIVLGIGVSIVLVVASLLTARKPLYRASLIRTAFWLPGIVSVLTVILFLVLAADTPPGELATDGLVSIVFGTGLGVATWVLYAVANQSFSTAASANSRSFSQLTTRRRLLGGEQDAYAARLDEIMACVDERWVLGTGYLDAWEVLHRGEEERLLDLDRDELVSAAFHDWLRLRGSNIPNAESMSEKTRMAAGFLVPDAYPYFLDPTGLATVQAPTNVTDVQRTTAKQMIRGIRKAVNIYREERYDRIVRARNQLFVTTMFTALIGYLGLGLGLLAGVPPSVVFAASAYFVVGAIVGMIVRLRTDSSRSVAMEDYGLSTARMLHTPLLSGLVGIAGVALIALAGNVSGILNVASSALSADNTPVTAPATPAPAEGAADGLATTADDAILVRVFDVGRYPAGLVIAAIFGFSPPLLLRGLQRHVDQYKLDLAASEPGGTPQREQ